jgi:hypothetical protein
MIKFYVAITRGKEQDYKEYLEPCLTRFQQQVFISFTKDQNITDESIAKKYNTAIESTINGNLINENDVVVFIKEDVSIVDNIFLNKIHTAFENQPEIGIAGYIGSSIIEKDMFWWKNKTTLRGHYLLEKDGQRGNGEHFDEKIGYFNDLVCLDNSILILRASLLTQYGLRFDEELSDDVIGFDMGLQVLEKKFLMSTLDFLVYRKYDIGQLILQEDKERLIQKWENKGLQFPITINSFDNIKGDEIIEIQI